MGMNNLTCLIETLYNNNRNLRNKINELNVELDKNDDILKDLIEQVVNFDLQDFDTNNSIDNTNNNWNEPGNNKTEPWINQPSSQSNQPNWNFLNNNNQPVKKEESKPEPQPGSQQGGGWGFSTFNPLNYNFEKKEEPEKVDYSKRPTKDKSDAQEGIKIVYCYESEEGIDIDSEDLDELLQDVNANDKGHVQNVLNNILKGTKNLFNTRKAGLYTQSIRVPMGLGSIPIEVRYNKVSETQAETKYSKLFSNTNSGPCY